VIALDTSLLVEAMSAGGTERTAFREALAAGHRMVLPTLVLYEWLRGPRVPEELAVQDAVLPAEEALPFGAEEARTAAELYGRVSCLRGREIDLAIAACAITWGAALWTLDPDDFRDIPGLPLFEPA
jgi:predicted nucleic acid-binding protein